VIYNPFSYQEGKKKSVSSKGGEKDSPLRISKGKKWEGGPNTMTRKCEKPREFLSGMKGGKRIEVRMGWSDIRESERRFGIG